MDRIGEVPGIRSTTGGVPRVIVPWATFFELHPKPENAASYTTGTVTTVNASTTIEGASTDWVTAGVDGDWWFKDSGGDWYDVGSRTDLDTIELAVPICWNGRRWRILYPC